MVGLISRVFPILCSVTPDNKWATPAGTVMWQVAKIFIVAQFCNWESMTSQQTICPALQSRNSTHSSMTLGELYESQSWNLRILPTAKPGGPHWYSHILERLSQSPSSSFTSTGLDIFLSLSTFPPSLWILTSGPSGIQLIKPVRVPERLLWSGEQPQEGNQPLSCLPLSPRKWLWR